ncbi:hypothetical protein ES703_85314 [subsurface metagenome]
MTDSNLIMGKIREELQKGLPSKRKILLHLVDLLNKKKYPSLADSEFYDIVGNTYQLNLDYKLNLKMLFYPIYKDLIKKINKLYSDEKRLEMAQYLIKNFGLFSTEQILNQIKEEFKQTPSKDLNLREFLSSKISIIFSDLLTKEEYQHLSGSDFNFIVGETFKLNPEFFMDSLYWDLRLRMEKKNRLIMDKYIIEKYSLIDEEHIIFECNGDIKLVDSQKGSLSVTSGSIFLTNYRLIAQGILDAKGPLTLLEIAKHILDIYAIVGGDISRRREATELLLESSLTFGYQFPSRNHINLKRKRNGVSYSCIQNNQFRTIQIKLPLETSNVKREEQVNNIFKILSKFTSS